MCGVTINSGSNRNIVSKKLANAVELKTKPHPIPYRVSWIKKGEAAVT